MTYKDVLERQIQKLEQEIEQATSDKEILTIKLNQLRMKQFEEDLREEPQQQLLKG